MAEVAAAGQPTEGNDIRWLGQRFWQALGGTGTLALVVLGVIGSLAVLTIGFAAIVIVQVVATDAGETVRGVPVPGLDLRTLLLGVAVMAIVGVGALLGADWLARVGAARCATELRKAIRRSSTDQGPLPMALLIQDVRNVANSAMLLSRLPGPVGVTVGGVAVLVVLDTALTAMLAPFAMLMVFVGRLMRADAERLSSVIEESRTRMVHLSRDAERECSPGEFDAEASIGDEASFRLAGQSSRSQAAGLASVGIVVVVAVLGTDVADSPTTASVARVIVYVIVARLVVRSLQQITATRAIVSRHRAAIGRCRAALVGGSEDSG